VSPPCSGAHDVDSQSRLLYTTTNEGQQKMRLSGFVVVTLLFATASWAGLTVSGAKAPALDEPGLIMLGIGLVGAGLAMLRRRRSK
jgi:hypothetical protein